MKSCLSCYVLHTPDKCPPLTFSRTRAIERPYHAIGIRQVHGLPQPGRVQIVTKDAIGRKIYQITLAEYLRVPVPLPTESRSIDVIDESDPPSQIPIDLEFLFIDPLLVP